MDETGSGCLWDGLTPTDDARTPDIVADARRHGEREGYTMTMKQKLEIHRQIKRQNQENVKKWKEGQK